MSILKDYQQFNGLTWVTGYLHNALAYQGVKAPHTEQPYSEAMLMGINGGITAGYFVFEYEGLMPEMHFLTVYPYNDDKFTPKVYDRLCIPTQIQQTTDPKKAVANLLNALAKGKPAIVWADVTRFPYFASDHYPDMWLVMPVVVYGCDLNSNEVHIADRARVPLTASTEELDHGRSRLKKQRFKMMTLDAPNEERLPKAIREGINACVDLFHSKGAPGASGNFGFSGLRKWAEALSATKGAKSWSKQFATGERMYTGLTTGYRFLEVWFTGGNGARGTYAQFLDEASVVLEKPALREAAELFRQSAALWGKLSESLLPDHIPRFKEARELLRRDYDLFMTKGNASIEERKQIIARLQSLKAEMAKDFPLSERESAEMRQDLSDQVMAIHDLEQNAVKVLEEVLG